MTGGVISFDLDGTLISGPFGLVLTDLQDDLVAEGVAPIKPQILQRHRQLLTTDPLAAYDWDTIVAENLAETGVQQPFDLVDRLHDHVRNSRTRLLHERTFESLAELHSAGWRVVVLTNGWRRYQEPILGGIGLLGAIDQLLTADDIGEPKPSTAAFAAARGDAEVHVHVGDRIDHDIVGGNASGARTVLLRADVPTRGPLRHPDSDVLGYLDKLAVQQQAASVEPPELKLPAYLATELSDIIGWLT
ncbi:MAG TPA: HAD family hydrolase [Microlunatus sp.]